MTRVFSLSLIAILVGTYFFIPSFQETINEAYQAFTSDDRTRITNYVQQFGFWGPAIVTVVMVAQMFLFVIPSWLLMIVSVLAYGKFWGVVLSVMAVFVASTVGYFIGNSLSETTIKRLVGQKNEKKLEKLLHKHGMGAVIIFRLAPFLSNDAISFIAGMLSMSYWRFITATLIGILPLAILIAFFSENTDKLKSGLIWVGGVSIVAYLAYAFYDYYKQKNDQ